MFKFEINKEKLHRLKKFLDKYKNLIPKPKREYDQIFATKKL